MSLQTVINYDDSANFTFDSSKVEFVGSKAQLKKIDLTGQTFNQAFSSDSGFTYDSAKAEFTGGLVQQKDTTATNSVLAAKYPTSINLNWHKSGGSTTGTANGTPTVSSGKLVCTGAAQKGVYYNRTTSAVETFKFKYTPNYSGSPSANLNVISTSLGSGGANNDRFLLTHSPSGDTFRITLDNASAASVISTATTIGASGVGLVSGTEYEIEVVLDSSNGTVRLFLDGTLYGTLSPGAWTRGSTALRYYVGADGEIYNVADASFDDYIVFNDAQHTASYTAGYTVADTIYATNKVELPQFTYSGVGDIQDFTNFSTTDTGSPRYVLNDLYWDGAAWSASDGSYAQANTEADVLANISSHPESDTMDIDVVFDDSNTQSSVDDLTLTYTGQQYPSDNPTILLNSGIEMDALEGFAESATKPSGSEIKYTLCVNNQDKYYNGSSWVDSNGTYSQANTAAEIETNKASLDLSEGATVKTKAFLNSDGSALPEITSNTIDYNFYSSEPSAISECNVYVFLEDIFQDIATLSSLSATFEIFSKKAFEHGGRIIAPILKSSTFNTNGYADVSVIETATPGEELQFRIKYTDPNDSSEKTIKFNPAVIPNQSSISLTDLTDVA